MQHFPPGLSSSSDQKGQDLNTTHLQVYLANFTGALQYIDSEKLFKSEDLDIPMSRSLSSLPSSSTGALTSDVASSTLSVTVPVKRSPSSEAFSSREPSPKDLSPQPESKTPGGTLSNRRDRKQGRSKEKVRHASPAGGSSVQRNPIGKDLKPDVNVSSTSAIPDSGIRSITDRDLLLWSGTTATPKTVPKTVPLPSTGFGSSTPKTLPKTAPLSSTSLVSSRKSTGSLGRPQTGASSAFSTARRTSWGADDRGYSTQSGSTPTRRGQPPSVIQLTLSDSEIQEEAGRAPENPLGDFLSRLRDSDDIVSGNRKHFG